MPVVNGPTGVDPGRTGRGRPPLLLLTAAVLVAAAFAASRRTLAPLWRTVQLAVLVSASTAVLGTALAWATTRTDLAGRRFWRIVVPLPLVYPSFVGAAAFISGLTPGGIVHDLAGGLGFDLAMQALGHEAMNPDRLASVATWTDLDGPTRPLTSLLPTEADPFFRLDLATEGAELDAGFAALVVLDGTGELAGGHGSTALRRGEVLAVPAAAGDWTVAGDARVLVARPGVSRG